MQDYAYGKALALSQKHVWYRNLTAGRAAIFNSSPWGLSPLFYLAAIWLPQQRWSLVILLKHWILFYLSVEFLCNYSSYLCKLCVGLELISFFFNYLYCLQRGREIIVGPLSSIGASTQTQTMQQEILTTMGENREKKIS